jgi:hypothetical protein
MKSQAQPIRSTKVGLLSLAMVAVTTTTSPAGAQRVDRQLRRPDAHAFLGAHGTATTSFAERTVTLPAAGEAEFDFFVDSEPNRDFLRVYVDGTQRFQSSGRNRAGRGRVPIPAGAHVLRFAYEKDAGSDAGRDVAFIDRLSIDGADPDSFAFDEPNLGPAPGWTSGGFGGGWTIAPRAARRGLRRAIEGAFTGYNPQGIRSSVERQITWPAGSGSNELSVTFFVDSEADRDFFRVYVDGVERFSASGAQKSGRTKIDVGAAGAHTIRLEYAKDESVDVGLDDVIVHQLEARANGELFEIANFDSATVGDAPDGWSKPAGADFGWVIAPGIRPEVFVSPLALTPLPPVDGEQEDAYEEATRVRIRDSDSVTAERSEAEILFNADPPTLFVLQRVQGRTPTLGGEDGQVTLYLDTKHLLTLSGGGCTGNSPLPGDEDRRIRLSYQAGAGAGVANVTVAQDVGTCASSAWRAATTSEALPVSAAIVEDDTDLGFVRIELSIELTAADVLADGLLGLGLSVDSAPAVSYKLPGHDGFPLLDNDVTSWENVIFARIAPNRRAPRHVLIDGAQRRDEGP